MATLEQMYPAVSNTPETSLAEAIGDRIVTITVINGDALPDAPNLITLGADLSSAETVLMTAKSGNTLTVVRGYDNTTAKAWEEGTLVGRYFTAHDQNTMQQNIEKVNEDLDNKAPVTVVLTGTLLADGWADGVQTIEFEGLLSNAAGIIGCPSSISSEALSAAKLAELTVISQAVGSVTVRADGVTPDADVPVVLTIWGQGGTNMTVISGFPAGSDSAEMETLKSRVSLLLEELTNNPDYAATAEVVDIRVSYGGTVYNTAGDAVRALGEQLANLQSDVDALKDSKFDHTELIDGYLYLYANGKLKEGPIGPFAGDGSGGGGSGTVDYGSTITLTNGLDSRNVTALDTDTNVWMKYTATSLDNNDNLPTGNLSEEWYVGSTRVSKRSVEQGSNEFDIRSYLSVGDNTVKLVITDAYGNSKPFIWSVTLSAYSISWNLDALSNHNSDSIVASIVINGEGTKYLNVTVDGEALITDQAVTTSGRTERVTIPAQAHGLHTVLAWFTVDVNGEPMTSEVLRHVGTWIVDGYTTPIVAVHNPELSVGQWGTVSLMYLVVDPTSETAAITLKENGVAVNVLNVDRSVQTWAYKGTEVGEHQLSIHCGSVSDMATVTVTSSGYDIAPITAGLVLDIDPTGHTNNEAGRANFGYTDGSGVNHPFVYSDNFDWTEGGFQIDDDGVTAFVVKRGCSVTLDTSLFADNAKTNGKEIKLIFRSANVRNYDAELISCLSGKIGLVVQAQQASVTSELNSMSVPYCEDRKIEMDVNIEASSENSMAYICLKSIPSCEPIRYGTTDNWAQTSPAMLKIGSDEADVWIYRMKVYGNSLTRYEILDNYIADCGDPAEMVARYERNDIYNDDGSISISKLTMKNPTLRAIHLWATKMTTGKSDKVTADVEIIYEAGGETHHMIAKDVVFKAQGTSSLEYILAALNIDIDFSAATSWVDGEGNAISSYAFTENSIAVDYFNIKADVASSESANNVCLADDYNTYNPYTCDAKKTSGVRDTIEGHPCALFFTNTADSTIQVGARTVAAGETILYFCGNMNNSKNNFAVFGQDNTKYPLQCCVEITNNNNGPARFRSSSFDIETWDGDVNTSNFEFRFPKSPTQEMKDAFIAMQTWVVSTCRDLAPGTALGTPVIIDGVTYANDTEEYRAAKFLAEFEDYFIKNQMLFHYLFTERHGMMDNRAKNLFMCYEYDADLDDYRWCVRCDYDNDTAEGCDNSGGATFTYGLEDTDMVGDSYAFNAHDSTLWCNIRDLMFSDLKTQYISSGNDGAWNATRILKKFNDYQAATPEALRSEDMFNKYFAPWLYAAEDAYLKRCHGPKEYWREQYEVYQEVYEDSKYCDYTNRENCISLRATTPNQTDGNMQITPYSDIYLNVMYGNAGTVRMRAKRNVTYDIVCPAERLDDTETYIFTASHLTEFGSLAALKTKFVTLTKAAKLQVLPIGSSEVGYENLNMTQLSLGNNTMLEYLDIRGLPNLSVDLDLSALSSLEEFYANGSGLTGLTLAQGAPLRIARVPAVASFIARDLTQLETFVMDGSGLIALRVENTPIIDTLALCKAATGLERGRLLDVDWTDDNADVLTRLAKLKGIDAQGNTVDTFVLTGKAYCSLITEGEIATINAAFPDLTLSYGEIVTSYQFEFQNKDGTTMKLKDGSDAIFTVRYGGSVENPVTAGLMDKPTQESTVEEDFNFTGWSGSLTNVITDTVVTPVFAATTRYYTVRHWYDDAESSKLQEDTVPAHGSVTYTGSDLTRSDGAAWMGWDAPTADITSDLDVHAVFVIPVLPDTVASDYDYLYSDDPDDNSAYTLAEFYGILVNGVSKQYFAVGDKIKIVPVTDVFADTEIILQVYGFNHYQLADGSGNFASTVFGMIGVMNATRGMYSSNNNVGGWPATTMRTYLNEKVFPALPRQWQTMIKQVEILSSAGGTTADIVSSDDYLFLFSHAEVGFDTSAVPYKNEIAEGAEAVTFSLFTSNDSRIKKTFNGEGPAVIWWLRSPDPASSTSYRAVNGNGFAYTSTAASGYYVSFGFCI